MNTNPNPTEPEENEDPIETTDAKDAVESLPGYQEYIKERSLEHLTYGDY